MHFCTPKLSLWLLTVLIIFNSCALMWSDRYFINLQEKFTKKCRFLFFFKSSDSNVLGGREVHQFTWMLALGLLSSSSLSFLFIPFVSYTDCLCFHLFPSEYPSADVYLAITTSFLFIWEKERNPAEGIIKSTFAPFPGCLGLLCTPSWLE